MADQATETYDKLDRYWGALKRQASDMAEVAKQAKDAREKIVADLESADDALKALKSSNAPGTADALSSAADWAEELRTKLRAAKIKEQEAQVQAAEARESSTTALDARRKGKDDLDAARELERQGITEEEEASRMAKQIEDEAHGLKPQVVQYRWKNLRRPENQLKRLGPL
jgi:hypothetical protein